MTDCIIIIIINYTRILITNYIINNIIIIIVVVIIIITNYIIMINPSTNDMNELRIQRKPFKICTNCFQSYKCTSHS